MSPYRGKARDAIPVLLFCLDLRCSLHDFTELTVDGTVFKTGGNLVPVILL